MKTRPLQLMLPIFLSLLLALTLVAPLVSHAAEQPPNFVVIFVDDLGYADLGCFDSPDIRTPILDELAGEGCDSLTSMPSISVDHRGRL